jgi:hypothetical protein
MILLLSYKNGIEVPIVITQINYVGQTATIEYKYIYEGKEYMHSNCLQIFWKMENELFRSQLHTTLLVHQPYQSFITELYFN